jgi:WD40 repeat protein
MNTNPPNPYVGPRTFLKNEGHLFFGRDREARDLLALVNSEKLVLFYAQSGAGKSSLINTRLIPSLETKKYEVLRVGRVGGEDFPGIEIDNIYAFNLMRSLIQQDIHPEVLAPLHLKEFLSGLRCRQLENENEYFCDLNLSANAERGTARRVLIVDQFEEIFSTHPEAWNKREAFFEQLAAAMESDSHLWVVLVMREDYIALVDPYAPLMPGGLRTRYYMQRLGREAAIEAVRKPVERLRPYEEGVAEKLVEDLSSIKVQQPDGTQETRPGQYVEAVQLQVVCYSLWQNLPENGTHITERDILEVGDVDEALGKYYSDRVAEVAQRKHVKERLIRDWIEDELIAPGGIRSMVLRETSRKSGGINDDVIQALQSDLVRPENRGGTIWYELTHDRLVSPILESNKKWFDENLSPLQRQATLWHDQDKNDSWLLRYEALAEVEQWADQNPDELSELEVEFLEACQEQQLRLKQRQQEQMLSARRMRTFLTITTVLAVIAGVAAIFGFVQSQRAEESATKAKAAQEEAQLASTAAVSQKRVAEASNLAAQAANATAQAASTLAVDQANRALAGNLAAQANSLRSTDHALALLVSMEAYQRDPHSLLTRTNLFQSVQYAPFTRMFGFERVAAVAVSPNGRIIAAASAREVTLINAETQQVISKISGELGDIQSVAFSPTSEILATGGCAPEDCSASEGQITLWDITSPEQPKPLANFRAHRAQVKTLAFDPRRPILASGGYDENIILWDISNPQAVTRPGPFLRGHASFVKSLAYHPSGNILASASDDKTILLWDVANLGNPVIIGVPYKGHIAAINSIAFRPDGNQLASASNDNNVLLWNFHPVNHSLTLDKTLKGHTGFVTALTYNTDGSVLASTGFDSSLILWDTNTGEPIGLPLHAHTNPINAIAFGRITSSNGSSQEYWLSGSSDRTVIQWNLSTYQPVASRTEATSGSPEIQVSSGPFTAEIDGQQIRLNNSILTGHTGTINSLSFSPQKIDGKLLLASGSDDQTVILWDVSSDPSKAGVFLRLEGFDNPIINTYFDSTRLITVDKSGQTIAWEIDPSQWIELACDSIKSHVAMDGETWQAFLSYFAGQSPTETCIQ